MTLRSKLIATDGRVLLYGTTPPREGSPEGVARFAADKLLERIRKLPLDGLVVYDLQDESGRTAVPRPFPFSRTVDSRVYSRLLASLTGKAVVCYKCIGQMTEAEWSEWLTETGREYDGRLLSVVGRPISKGVSYPMSLARAFEIAAVHPSGFLLGAVAIAEREDASLRESRRMLDKMRNGCGFFVSQAVYAVEPTIRLLGDYVRECRAAGLAPRRVVLTFAPCGREKTIAFIKWLGIAFPPATERTILSAPNPLAKSIEICRANLLEILERLEPGTVPLGINIESVSINKDEIDASVDLFHALAEVLESRLPRWSRTSTP